MAVHTLKAPSTRGVPVSQMRLFLLAREALVTLRHHGMRQQSRRTRLQFAALPRACPVVHCATLARFAIPRCRCRLALGVAEADRSR